MAYANNDAYGQTEQGYGGGYDGYGQSHEMQQYPQQGAAATLSLNEFLNEITAIRQNIQQLERNFEELGRLRTAALNDTDGGRSAQFLENKEAEVAAQRQEILGGLRTLTDDASKTTDSSKSLKEQHLNTTKNSFKDVLNRYQTEETEHRRRYQNQIRRQILIVNPDATDEQLNDAVNNWGDDGVFQTALRSNRTGQATSVLGNVRARHNELQRIEKEIIELANMFQDLDMLVVQQEVAIQAAEQNAENTTKWTEEGNQHVRSGIKSARNRRKLKWWCLLVCILIIIIAVGVGAGVACGNGLCGSKNNNNNNNNN